MNAAAFTNVDGAETPEGRLAAWKGRLGFAGLGFRHEHGDHALAFFQVHAAHATGLAAHVAHVVFIKAHGLAAVRKQHDVVLTDAGVPEDPRSVR